MGDQAQSETAIGARVDKLAIDALRPILTDNYDALGALYDDPNKCVGFPKTTELPDKITDGLALEIAQGQTPLAKRLLAIMKSFNGLSPETRKKLELLEKFSQIRADPVKAYEDMLTIAISDGIRSAAVARVLNEYDKASIPTRAAIYSANPEIEIVQKEFFSKGTNGYQSNGITTATFNINPVTITGPITSYQATKTRENMENGVYQWLVDKDKMLTPDQRLVAARIMAKRIIEMMKDPNYVIPSQEQLGDDIARVCAAKLDEKDKRGTHVQWSLIDDVCKGDTDHTIEALRKKLGKFHLFGANKDFDLTGSLAKGLGDAIKEDKKGELFEMLKNMRGILLGKQQVSSASPAVDSPVASLLSDVTLPQYITHDPTGTFTGVPPVIDVTPRDNQLS